MPGVRLPSLPLPPLPSTGLQLGDGTTARVSISTHRTQGNARSYGPSISADGRYVAFTSEASNLAVGDANGVRDVFVRDRTDGITLRVSVDSLGLEGNARSYGPSISADAHYVAFTSEASNLVPGDTNGFSDVFVHDTETGETSRVSVSSDGIEANSWSSDAAISADGRYVAFTSQASNLVPGDTNGLADVFVHDRETGETTRVSVDSADSQSNGWSHTPAISSDGRYVAFTSEASNLVSGDTNAQPDVFVHDRQTATTSRVSVSSSGGQGNGSSHTPSISSDGRYVAFTSEASNLVSGDTNAQPDVFVHDRQTATTSRVSVSSSGGQGNGSSHTPAISSDGRYVAFTSEAPNLVSGDTNGVADTFLHDRVTGETTRRSVTRTGEEANSWSHNPSIASDVLDVAFTSNASNLISGDTNEVTDVFVRVDDAQP